jgi:hypothetical protein
MTEIEVLPGRAARRRGVLDDLTIDQHLDGPDVTPEVASVRVRLRQAGGRDLRVVLGRLRRAMTEPRLQLEQGHRLLGVVELARDRGARPMARDAAARVLPWHARLAAERRDQRVIEVFARDAPGSKTEQQRHGFTRPRIEPQRLHGPDGFPRLDRSADERIDGLGEGGARLVCRDVEQTHRVLWGFGR